MRDRKDSLVLAKAALKKVACVADNVIPMELEKKPSVKNKSSLKSRSLAKNILKEMKCQILLKASHILLKDYDSD